ncbi:hypothetical protein [Streptomyces cavernae]|uniref:hypothetical protein n=1 Tax=Streptomyces cavernae TaxID=2259034 RepID=UPI0030B808B4
MLIGVACVLLPLGTMSSWATYEFGGSDRYVATMAPLAGDPDVRTAVADAVTDGIMAELHVGPLRDRVRAFVHEAARSFTGTEAFRTAWDTANRATHDAVLEALRSEHEGGVTLDAAPLTQELKDRLHDDGVPFAHRIPVEHTEVTVLRPTELATLREGFGMLELADFWLPAAALALAVAGIAVAACRRRAVTATALGMALGAALLLGAVGVTRELTLAGLPPEIPRAAAAAVYDTLTATLRTASWTILALGLTAALATQVTHRVRRRRRGPTADAGSRPPPGPGGPVSPGTT